MSLKKQIAEQEKIQLKLLQEANAKLRAGLGVKAPPLAIPAVPAKRAFGLSVSDRGAVNVEGPCSRPVGLYPEQWEEILARAAEVSAFIKANKGRTRNVDASGAREDLEAFMARMAS